MPSHQVLPDEILIRLLQELCEQERNLSLIEEAGINLNPLYTNMLTTILDAMGLPPEEAHGDDSRDWIWTLFTEYKDDGRSHDMAAFLARCAPGSKNGKLSCARLSSTACSMPVDELIKDAFAF